MKISRHSLRLRLFFLCLLVLLTHVGIIISAFGMISSYLVSVPLFKGHGGLVNNCLFVCLLIIQIHLFHDGSFCIFDYFVMSPLVFVINFVTLPPSFAKTGPQSDNQVSCGT